MHALGVLIGPKGRGTNLRAIVEACESGLLDARVRVVVSPVAQAPAVDYARQHQISTVIASPKKLGEEYGAALVAALRDCDLICLAGYLRLLPSDVLKAHPGKILNIHPALLPKFGGKGMFGMHVHEAVVAAGETETGCTVHLVDERYDEGEVVLQRMLKLEPGDSPATVAEKVLELEKVAYPAAIKKVLDGTAP